MPAITDSPEWLALEGELDSLAKAARAFNVYVLDAWGNVWCAAHGGLQWRRDDCPSRLRGVPAPAVTRLRCVDDRTERAPRSLPGRGQPRMGGSGWGCQGRGFRLEGLPSCICYRGW